MHRAAPILALYLAACGSHESDAPPTPPPTRDEAPDETPEPPESPDEAETDEPSIGALVRLGRAHFRERRFAEAAASFDRALARNPGDGGLSCETGWAFHHAGDDAKARRLLQHGTRLLASREDRKRSYGACLYNLGRMAEDAGQDEAAARLYATSLRARPNRIVQRRLDALEVDLEAERPLYGTVHDAVDGAEGLTGENRDDMLYYVRDLDTRAHALPPRPPVLEVATVSYGDGGAWRCRFYRLTARLDAGWVEPVELGDACSAEEEGYYDGGSFEVSSIVWVEGQTAPTLALRVTTTYQSCEYEEEEICSGNRDASLQVFRYRARGLEPLFELPLSREETADGETVDAFRSEHELTEDGRITVRAVEGAPPPWTLGTHTVDELTTAAEREAAARR